MVTNVCASVPCKRPQTIWTVCVCVCEGKGQSLGAQTEKQSPDRRMVWRGMLEVFSGFCFSPKKELRVWGKQLPRGEVRLWQTFTAQGAHRETDHHKWHISDLSHNSSTVHIIYLNVERFPLFTTFLLLSCSQPPNLSLPLFLLFMRLRFHSGHMFWWRHAYSHTHTNTLIFMSLCSHCVHMLSLVLRCCSAAHKLAFSPRPSNKT